MSNPNKKEQMVNIVTKMIKEEGLYDAHGRPKKDDVFCRYLALVIIDSLEEDLKKERDKKERAKEVTTKVKPECWECKHFELFNGREYKGCYEPGCPVYDHVVWIRR